MVVFTLKNRHNSSDFLNFTLKIAHEIFWNTRINYLIEIVNTVVLCCMNGTYVLFKSNSKWVVCCISLEQSNSRNVLVEVLGFVGGNVIYKCSCIELVASMEFLFVVVCSYSTFDEWGCNMRHLGLVCPNDLVIEIEIWSLDSFLLYAVFVFGGIRLHDWKWWCMHGLNWFFGEN